MPHACRHLIVMGVSGSGKTTVATALGREFDLELMEGDDHHPPANVKKMRAGFPLADEDRRPWLEELTRLMADRHERGRGTVLACSALRRAYRDTLRSAAPPEETFVIELDADADVLRVRMKKRKGHFMPASLLESQLATLGHLSEHETGVIVDAGRSEKAVIAESIAAVRASY